MRGLKLFRNSGTIGDRRSHLLQMRGLKLAIYCAQRRGQYVASFTDAWIETLDKEDDWKDPAVASFTDAWIETHRRSSGTTAIMVASFTDAWIETVRGCKEVDSLASRIFYRCVD